LEVFTLPLVFRADSGRTPSDSTIQNAEFLALEVLQFSGDFPVTFRCMLAGLVSPTDFLAGLSAGMSPDNSRKSDGSPADSNGHHADRFPY
jgi:hypothetical protein